MAETMKTLFAGLVRTGPHGTLCWSKPIFIKKGWIPGTRRHNATHFVRAGSMEATQIPNVSKVGSGITRILGQNPGPYTLQGTNTYLIAGEQSSVLIDTGEGKDSYLGLLEPVLRSNPPVSDIILTHRHRDHVGGLPSVLNLLSSLGGPCTSPPVRRMPKVWKFRSDGASYDRDIQEVLVQHFEASSSNSSDIRSKPGCDASETPELNFLSEHQEFRLSSVAKLQITHTPGHTEDSISCLLLEDPHVQVDGEEARGDTLDSRKEEVLSAIFVGDTILGGSSSAFEDLLVYLQSLQKLLDISNRATRTDLPVRLYPAHGHIILDGPAVIRQFIDHRLARERQILDCFRQHGRLISSSADPAARCLTPEKLIELMYPAELPKAVYPAALRGIHQHLKKLQEEGLVDRCGPNPAELWCLVERADT
ncbi:hypothetical protein PTTG_06576 [Puccinia triticina 1-1 BBBD Race 1]|uniref:Lactamase_B domain-containing protein n=2 Tax=Puccinia triticina TaxID=208348 RepID=A0A180GLP1_PUCT1|nr:uncharacterized protein PtA15_7A294 [Puccinia triticina]OAV93676.1 hypothetical protein PTTG_06576 [Puccinia triticina 1-1 BBBD Race 1]WAQ86568.1 hypothetical protein PtA15_7A294 [Puccinia triticina]WAR56429.1 hypothetical protein PtB15_7B278 [Puccinia triticina]